MEDRASSSCASGQVSPITDTNGFFSFCFAGEFDDVGTCVRVGELCFFFGQLDDGAVRCGWQNMSLMPSGDSAILGQTFSSVDSVLMRQATKTSRYWWTD